MTSAIRDIQASGQRRFRPAAGVRRRGFSFTEIMFAIVILGIGFIMVAAIFPVSLQQAKLSTEEVTAAPVARGAMSTMGNVLKDGPNSPVPASYSAGAITYDAATNTSNCPPLIVSGGSISLVGQVGILPIDPTSLSTFHAPSLWSSIRGNVIGADDPRYGWVTLYRRSVDGSTPPLSASYAQVFVFPVQTRNSSVFEAADTILPNVSALPGYTAEANLMAHRVLVAIYDNVTALGDIDLIAFDTSVAGVQTTDNAQAAVENGYVVISHDQISGPSAGRMNGRIYRIGTRRPDLDSNPAYFPIATSIVFELVPGNDFTPDPGADNLFGTSDDVIDIGPTNVNPASTPAEAFVIGRGFDVNYSLTGAPFYEGPSMALGAYTTFVKVNK
jgi:prepilin-type N-terminal cleavage/methylation domain-containing protein